MMPTCYACGTPVDPRSTHATLRLAGEAYFLCCPMCVSSIEAGRIQKLLVPRSFSDDKVDVLVEYVPALQVGGDFACVRYGSAGSLYVVIGDVAGHGITSSLLVSRLSGEAERVVDENGGLRDLATTLNHLMHDLVGEEGLYVTLATASVDFRSRVLSYINCGHPAPRLWSSASSQVRALTSANLPLGMFDDDVFGDPRIHTMDVGAGDALMLFTDGLLDVRGDVEPQLSDLEIANIFQQLRQSPPPASMSDIVGRWTTARVSSPPDDVLLTVVRLKAL